VGIAPQGVNIQPSVIYISPYGLNVSPQGAPCPPPAKGPCCHAMHMCWCGGGLSRRHAACLRLVPMPEFWLRMLAHAAVLCVSASALPCALFCCGCSWSRPALVCAGFNVQPQLIAVTPIEYNNQPQVRRPSAARPCGRPAG